MYEYVRRYYKTDPIVGQRVRHTENRREGVITPEGSQGHYVMVQFDGYDFSLPCHPKALEDVKTA